VCTHSAANMRATSLPSRNHCLQRLQQPVHGPCKGRATAGCNGGTILISVERCVRDGRHMLLQHQEGILPGKLLVEWLEREDWRSVVTSSGNSHAYLRGHS
jgi:hypothetical protein